MAVQPVFTTLRIREIIPAANNVKLFVFEDAGLRFRAGQYLTFVTWDNGNEVRRSYSIASSPAVNEPLYIGVKRIANGLFSRRLYDLAQPGDELQTLGAGGVFVFPLEMRPFQRVYFFAAGSGIIPVFSLLKTALYEHAHLHLVLVYSNHSVSSTIFYKELLQLKEDFPGRLELLMLFSDSPELARARLHADMITDILDRFGDRDRALYYTCGPENYMRRVVYTLRGLGIPAERIKRELFHSSYTIKRMEPPDKNAHEVVIKTRGEHYRVQVQFPETILQAARQEGLVLPYSCETGRCGNCVAKCEEGKVWMSYNEVLTEAEIKKGLVLTCTGFPVDGDVVIRI